MRRRAAWHGVGVAVLGLATLPAQAAGHRIGISISIDGDGFFLNPVIKKVTVTEVAAESAALAAGIAVGDEILRVDGHPVVGQRGRDLQPYLDFPPGQKRHLHLRHVDGTEFDADLMKPTN